MLHRAREDLTVQRVCVTGGAGFIGSNLVDRLLADGVEVTVVDDLRTGSRDYLADAARHGGFRLVEGDVLDQALLTEAFAGCDWVFHLQANADVRHGLEHPTRDLEQNTIATSRVLEAMRAAGSSRILFASTGSIYGEPQVFPTPEDAPFPIQTSLYGASKLACEGLIEAYAAGFGFVGVICRFVSVLGERYTHGHVIDFYRALKSDPDRLVVLGNGKQEKSYLYVQDCVAAMLLAARHHAASPGAHVYNLGTEETLTVDQSVELITRHLGVSPTIEYAGGERGWIGDSPLILLDVSRIRSLGWKPELSIAQAIERTLDWLDGHPAAWQAGTRKGGATT